MYPYPDSGLSVTDDWCEFLGKKLAEKSILDPKRFHLSKKLMFLKQSSKTWNFKSSKLQKLKKTIEKIKDLCFRSKVQKHSEIRKFETSET